MLRAFFWVFLFSVASYGEESNFDQWSKECAAIGGVFNHSDEEGTFCSAGKLGRLNPEATHYFFLQKETKKPEKECNDGDIGPFRSGSCPTKKTDRPTISPDDPQCVTFRDLVAACAKDTDNAEKNDCNPKADTGVQSVVQGATLLTKMAAASTNIALFCSEVGKITGMANAALAAFNTSCVIAQDSCTKSCDAAKKMRSQVPGVNECPASERLTRTDKVCQSFTTTMKDAASQIVAVVNTQGMAQKCAGLTATLPTICQSNPSAPICMAGKSADCSDPSVAASNPVCIGQGSSGLNQGSNSLPSYMDSTGGGGSGAGGTGADGSGGGRYSLTGPEGDSSFNSEFQRPGGGGGAAGPNGRANGGGLGPGHGGPDGNSAAKPGQRGGGGTGTFNTKINGGYYGGGGGFSVGGGGYENNDRGNNSAGGPNGNGQPGVDLKQFLPGGKMDPSRSLAGISGPDGITGPNSDIWQKVNTRYRSVGSSMKP